MPALAEHHAFTVSVAGVDLSGPYEDALYEAGCDDATIVVRDGTLHLDFERPGASFSDAVGSAMHDVERAGARVLKIERIED
jgi:hypothetical protein